MKRIIIFWDVSNFFYSLKNLQNGRSLKFDFPRFAKALQSNNDLIKIYFACSKDAENDKITEFFNHIDSAPYFYVKDFIRNSSGVEKQVDVYLASQMVALAYENAYDIAYLISGDIDFVPAIEIVQQKGKIVVAVGVSKTMSNILRRKADWCILIDDDKEKVQQPYFYRNYLLAE